MLLRNCLLENNQIYISSLNGILEYRREGERERERGGGEREREREREK